MASTWIEPGMLEMSELYSNANAELYCNVNAALSDGFWMPGGLALETETLTRALQISLTHGSSPESSCAPSPVTSLGFSGASLPFASDSESGSRRLKKAPSIPVSSGKVAKRKPRASKRTPITYIEANPANFREMVQQITGLQVGEEFFPVAEKVENQWTRAPKAPAPAVPQGFLPTLDTSAFLLERAAAPATSLEVGGGSYFAAADGEDGGLAGEFEAFSCFPTPDVWESLVDMGF